MTGPKLNETQRVAGEKVGTRASARNVRGSASKVRVVLDLIRGLPVRRADEVLQFTEREAARVVRKVLASAVANAVHNDEQDPDELFVVACYADEGPTMRRFKPRARGRATRIRKRTSHITVIVARMSDERLAIEEARSAGRSTSAAASRRARVERGRQRTQAKAASAQVEEAQVEEAQVEEAQVEEAQVEEAQVEEATDEATSGTDEENN
jgi:large subunit ribosomal protein L22